MNRGEMKLIFATGNRNKQEEVAQIMGSNFEIETPADYGITEEIPEDQPTLEGNALQKARYVYDKIGISAFADDTGLEVDSLGGEPGVRSARYATDGHDFEANIDLLLERLGESLSREARFRTVVALIHQGREYLFEGEVRGEILRERRGCGGFGYDAVFMPHGYSESFAEMDTRQKNAISHRARAIENFVEFLPKVIKTNR